MKIPRSLIIVLFVVLKAFLPSTFAMYMVLLSYGGWFAGNYTVSSIFHQHLGISLLFSAGGQLVFTGGLN